MMKEATWNFVPRKTIITVCQYITIWIFSSEELETKTGGSTKQAAFVAYRQDKEVSSTIVYQLFWIQLYREGSEMNMTKLTS